MRSSTDSCKTIPTKYYNPHIVYIKTGIANINQLRANINSALVSAGEQLGHPVKTFFRINLVKKNDGTPYGHAYIWFTNIEVAYILLGNNPDGSERVTYMDDPDWKPHVQAKEIFQQNFEDFSFPTNKSWADSAEEEEALFCPRLKNQLPSLAVLGTYKLSPEQKIQYLKLLQDPNSIIKSSTQTNNINEVPDEMTFEVSPAFVYPVDDKYCSYVLYSKNVPDWVTPQILKNEFSHYASDSTTKYSKKINGVMKEDTYPFVSINNKRIAFITFNPSTHDAQFARLMTRKLELKHNDKLATLVFDHSFNAL